VDKLIKILTKVWTRFIGTDVGINRERRGFIVRVNSGHIVQSLKLVSDNRGTFNVYRQDCQTQTLDEWFECARERFFAAFQTRWSNSCELN
jgi:hypothetical protein